MTEQVFGPGRPVAAVLAIQELAQAQEDAFFSCWTDERAQQRVREAQRVRDMYAEYGGTFRAH